FFFSSRRRHTRFSRDWSSDVCSSDLAIDGGGDVVEAADRDGGHLAAAAVGGLYAGHALQRLDQVVVGELADVLGDDRIDDLHRALLDLQRVDHARAQAAHFDALQFGGACGRVGRARGVRIVRRGAGLQLLRSGGQGGQRKQQRGRKRGTAQGAGRDL